MRDFLLLINWEHVVIWCLALSVLDFSLMGIDKRRAKAHRWRVPEKWFFILAALGGSLGANLGMWTFRHKTRHWYFKFGLPVIFILQAGAGALIWYFMKAPVVP